MRNKFENYEEPLVEVLHVEVEQGFTVSAPMTLPGLPELNEGGELNPFI